MTCTTRLLFYDNEREMIQLEAMSGVQIRKALGGSEPAQTITPDNFRDQTW